MSHAEPQKLHAVDFAQRGCAGGLLQVLIADRARDPRRPRVHAVETTALDARVHAYSLDDLLQKAERAAHLLEMAGARPGDRVLLCLSDVRTFLPWFLGALGRGMTAVPSPPFETLGASAHPEIRIRGILADCDPRVAIVEDEARFRSALPESKATVLGEWAFGDSGPSLELFDPRGSETAFLQYTSGSTGSPKGVVISHDNLSANLRTLCEGTVIADKERMFSWLPLHHDMGLIGGMLWPLFCGSETYVTKPFTFITRPASWLESIARFGITVAMAPNFAYSVCAHKISDQKLVGVDLSTLRIAICAAEPIDVGVVRAFTERFAPYGLGPAVFYPLYGMAEATAAICAHERGARVRLDVVDRRRLAATGRAIPASPDTSLTQTLVSVGRALPEHEIEIRAVDTGLLCKERCVGEVIVKGPSLSARYWSEPATAKREALASGDLGYMADGELYIVDRLKDLIIVAGQNYSSPDIEAAATERTGARMGRVVAFGVRRPETGTEAVIVVAEVDPNDVARHAAIRTAIEEAVRSRIGLQCEAVLAMPGSIEKTTSGKLRRSACKERFSSGSLAIITPQHDAKELATAP